MFSALFDWLLGAGREAAVFIISMVPLVELRGAVPLGAAAGIPWTTLFPLAILGNMLPIPLLLVFGEKLLAWAETLPPLRKFAAAYKKKLLSKSGEVTKYARLGRSLVLKIRHCDYVEAAIVTGSKTPYMILRYMLPNALPTLIITAATDIGGMMLELAAMSFLGFGAKPPAPEWGYMLNEGRACIQSAPWMMIFPGLAIFIVVVVFNMLGDSLRDILDPKDE